MDIQKIALGTIAGAIALFFAGWGIWGFALHKIQSENMTMYEGLIKEFPNLGMIFAAMVVTALLWTIIFNRWAGIKTFVTGAKAGALIAALSGLGVGLMMMATQNLYGWPVVFSDLVGNLVWGAIGGGVIGWVLGRGSE